TSRANPALAFWLRLGELRKGVLGSVGAIWSRLANHWVACTPTARPPPPAAMSQRASARCASRSNWGSAASARPKFLRNFGLGDAREAPHHASRWRGPRRECLSKTAWALREQLAELRPSQSKHARHLPDSAIGGTQHARIAPRCGGAAIQQPVA